MGIGGVLLELGRYLEACERTPGVDSVGLDEDGAPGTAGSVTATVELTLSTCPAGEGANALDLADTRVDDDGRIRASFETPEAVLPERPDGVEIATRETRVTEDGRIAVRLVATAVAQEAGQRATGRGDAGVAGATDTPAAGRGDAGAAGATDAPAAGRGDTPAAADAGPPGQVAGDDQGVEHDADADERASQQTHATRTGADTDRSSERDLPPFRDHALLREVYESCGTFAEMSDALEMDVTGETVRRYMIDAGIHEPDSYGSSGADDAERDEEGVDEGAAVAGTDPREDTGRGSAEEDLDSPVVLTDGIGLPEGVQIETIVETVKRSNTLYEVKTAIGIGREEALEILQQLDLLDHVVGRLATADEREVTRELVVERLRENAEPR